MLPVKVARPFSTTGKSAGAAQNGSERKPISEAGSGNGQPERRRERKRAGGLHVTGGSGQVELREIECVVARIVGAVSVSGER